MRRRFGTKSIVIVMVLVAFSFFSAVARANSIDPRLSWGGDTEDNTWTWNYVICNDGFVLHADQQMAGEANKAFSVQLTKVSDATGLPTDASLGDLSNNVSMKSINGTSINSTISPTEIAGGSSPDSSNLLHASIVGLFTSTKDTGTPIVLTTERWDHGASGPQEDSDQLTNYAAGGWADMDESSGALDTTDDSTAHVGDGSGFDDILQSDQISIDGTPSYEIQPNWDQTDAEVQDCSAVPTTTASPSPAPNSNLASNGAGWNNSNVKVTLTSTDSAANSVDSNLAPAVLTYSMTRAQTKSGVVYNSNPPASSLTVALSVTAEGTTTFTFHATDTKGNAERTETFYINLDKTPPTKPTFTWQAGYPPIVDDTSYTTANLPPGPTGCTATDALSGLNSCTVAGYSTSPGKHTITATATDNAGNTSMSKITYTVVS